MNEAQRFVADNYSDGDFDYIRTVREAETCHDGLFAHLISEAAGADDLEQLDEVVGGAVDQLMDLNSALVRKLCAR